MDPVILLYTVLLATAFGLSWFHHHDHQRQGRVLLISAVLAGFLLTAAVSALVLATSVLGQTLSALATLFAAQASMASFALLWHEINADAGEPDGSAEDSSA